MDKAFEVNCPADASAWIFEGFRAIWKAYRKKTLKPTPFFGVSPTLQIQRAVRPKFKSQVDGIVTGFVGIMANASVEESSAELLKKITERAATQLPDNIDLAELPVDRILEIVNFKSIQQLSQVQRS